MDERNLDLMRAWVPDTYVQQGAQSLAARSGKLRSLLTQRRVPEEGWEEEDVEAVLREIAWMDSNHFPGRVGVGEREGRVWSSIVRRRHFGLAHGIGRSGDIAAIQPKAAGSSLLNKLTNTLLCDWLRRCGLRRVRACVLFPLATGMTLSLCMLTLRQRRPAGAKYVIWPRIDQKSCFKSILTAGLEPVVLEPVVGDTGQLRIPAESVQAAIEERGADAIVCVMTTTSCFAPRGFDDVEAIARICHELHVPHLVNHAYGVQSSKLCHVVNEAIGAGRVDAVVQSTDKNLLVPVGGAIVASMDPGLVDRISKTYPGRASASPLIDVLATLLQMVRVPIPPWFDSILVFPLLDSAVWFSVVCGVTGRPPPAGGPGGAETDVPVPARPAAGVGSAARGGAH